MPTYLYVCGSLANPGKHGEFETEHSIKIKLTECPHCAEEGNPNQPVQRLIASATPGKMEMNGDELQAHIKADAKRIQREAANNPNKYANLIGESRYHQLQTKLDRRNK